MTATRPTMKHHAAPATDRQLSYLDSLARRAGYSYPDQAVKDVIGKRPSAASPAPAPRW